MANLRVLTVILTLGLTAVAFTGCAEPCPLWQQINGGC